MRKYCAPVGLLLLLSIILVLPGCTRAGSSLNGSGKIVDQEFKVSEFNSISAKGAFIIEIQQAETYQVIVSTDDNLFNRVKLSMERKTLKMSIEAPATFFPTNLKVKITLPEINGLNLSLGAQATIADYQSAGNFSLFLADKSSLQGNLTAGETSFHLSGASTAILSGSVPKLDLISLEESKLDLRNFVLFQAKIRLDNKSEAIINISGQFDVNLNNQSKVYFLGNPIFTNTSISGGSSMSMIQN